MTNRFLYEAYDPWPFKCSNCLHEFTEQIGRVQAGAQVVCPSCRTWLTDHDKEFVVRLTQARNGIFDPWGHMRLIKKPE
jgi:hypothetical protein